MDKGNKLHINIDKQYSTAKHGNTVTEVFAKTSFFLLMLFFVLVILPGICLSQNSVKHVDANIKTSSAALDSIKNELERGRKRLSELSRDEGSFSERLSLSEKNIATAATYLSSLQANIDSTDHNIKNLNHSLEKATVSLVERQKSMRKRLRVMYKTGPIDFVQMAAVSSGIRDILNRMIYFQSLRKYDETLLRTISDTRKDITRQTDVLLEKQAQLTSLKSIKETEQKKFLADRDIHSEMLSKVRFEKSVWEQTVRDLETAQKELSALLSTLQKKRIKAKAAEKRAPAGATTFEKLKGRLPWPAKGDVLKGFGKIVHPVYKTVTMNTGIDISIPQNTDITCVSKGRVEYAGWMRGYGNFVIVNHSGGYVTIYAHLKEITAQVNQDVTTGTKIGKAGDGGAESEPRLHFQIRKETEPLDPGQWLEAR